MPSASFESPISACSVREMFLLMSVGSIRVVDERLVGRGEADAEARRREAGAGAEHHVRLLHVLEHGARAWRRRRSPATAGESPGRSSCPRGSWYRRFQQLGHGLQLVPGLRVVHALAGVDQRALGVDQRGGGGVDVCRIRRGQQRGAPACSRGRPVRHFLVPHVARHFDQHGAGAAVARLRERAAQAPARSARARVICSACLVMCWKFSAALKAGLTQPGRAPSRPGSRPAARLPSRPARRRRTRSRRPGRPAWQNTPTFSPEVRRLIRRPPCGTPMRSWRTMIGRMPASAADSVKRVQRVGQQVFAAFSLHDLGYDLRYVHRLVPRKEI